MSRKLRFMFTEIMTRICPEVNKPLCTHTYLPHQDGILTITISYQQIYPEEHYIVARYSDIFLKPLQYPKDHPH